MESIVWPRASIKWTPSLWAFRDVGGLDGPEGRSHSATDLGNVLQYGLQIAARGEVAVVRIDAADPRTVAALRHHVTQMRQLGGAADLGDLRDVGVGDEAMVGPGSAPGVPGHARLLFEVDH